MFPSAIATLEAIITFQASALFERHHLLHRFAPVRHSLCRRKTLPDGVLAPYAGFSPDNMSFVDN